MSTGLGVAGSRRVLALAALLLFATFVSMNPAARGESALPNQARSVEAVAATTSGPTCSGSPISAVASAASSVEEVAIDASASTRSAALRAGYEQAVLAVVAHAASEDAALRVVVFGPSGVGARVVFAGSFAPASSVMAFNLASMNRTRCLAQQTVAAAFGSRSTMVGTDVAGAIVSAVTSARALVKPGGRVAVTVLTDGCQAPARSGPNRQLTDLCGRLDAGVPPATIVARHRAEFALGDLRGVVLTMAGVGVGRFADAASTARAEELVGFWQAACQRAGAAQCEIESAVQ